jgi:hypothetical protein
MIAIGRTLVSEDLLDRRFVCDLSACKGACCVQGDAGAPLLDEEIGVMEEALDVVLPYMDDEGRAEVSRAGVFTMDIDGDLGTPLIDGGRCAYSIIAADGTATCAIEKAHLDGVLPRFRKPVSCHLYPVRVKDYTEYQAVNYDRWDVCRPACACGDRLEVPVFRFVREALIRRFGTEWYEELEMVDQLRRSADQ